MRAVTPVQLAEEWRRFTGHESNGGDLALAQLIDCHLLIVIGGGDR